MGKSDETKGAAKLRRMKAKSCDDDPEEVHSSEEGRLKRFKNKLSTGDAAPPREAALGVSPVATKIPPPLPPSIIARAKAKMLPRNAGAASYLEPEPYAFEVLTAKTKKKKRNFKKLETIPEEPSGSGEAGEDLSGEFITPADPCTGP